MFSLLFNDKIRRILQNSAGGGGGGDGGRGHGEIYRAVVSLPLKSEDFSVLIAQLSGRTDVRMLGTRLLKVIDFHRCAELSLFHAKNNARSVIAALIMF